MLDGGQEVAKSSEHEKDGSSKQTGSLWNCAQPLDQTHDTVDAGARVVGRDLADGGIERGRGWADPKEKRHLNKEDDEGRGPAGMSVSAIASELVTLCPRPRLSTYNAKAQKRYMITTTVKMFEMPRAKHKIMDRIPSLIGSLSAMSSTIPRAVHHSPAVALMQFATMRQFYHSIGMREAGRVEKDLGELTIVHRYLRASFKLVSHGPTAEFTMLLGALTEVSCSKFLLERHLGGRFGVVDEEDVGVFACFAPVM